MGDVRKLEVLELSIDLAAIIYKQTSDGQWSKDFGLKDQIRRASVSIPSNIAEGAASGFEKLGLRYFYNARGSLVELETQLIIASKIGYIEHSEYITLQNKIDLILKKTNALINYRKGIVKMK